MYKVSIEEFENIGWVHYFDEQVFYQTRDSVYKEVNNTWSLLYRRNKKDYEHDLVARCNLFWLTSGKNNVWSSTLLKFESNEIEGVTNVNGSLYGSELLNNQLDYVANEIVNEAECIVLGNLKSANPQKIVACDFFAKIINYKETIIVRGRNDDSALICFDHHLNELWRTPLQYSRGGLRGLPCYPEIYKDIVYLNMPEYAFYQETPTPMDIGAFCAKTGQSLWSDTLPCCARNADLHGSEVYIASDQFLQIRDVTTGKVVWEMLPFWSEDESPCHLYPLNENDLLVNFQFKNFAWVINRSDNSIKQTITLPEDSYYCLSTTTLPTKIADNRWAWEAEYTNFTQNSRNSAVVIIDLDNSQPEDAEATIKPRPKHKLRGKTVETGEKEYFLEIDHDNLDEVIRYGVIIIKNFGHDKGCAYPRLKPDRKHNGKIYVTVKKKSLDTDKTDAEIITALADIKMLCEDTFQSLNIRAGNGKDSLILDIKLI